MKYEDKLRDPRWQRKRLEVMAAADWKCQDCGDGKEELHVHHLLYSGDREPWEYANSGLLCTCDTCHKIRHMDPDKVRIHAERLNVTFKTIYIFNRWWRFTKDVQAKCPEARLLMGQILLEHKAFERSVKERVGNLKLKLWKANLTERDKQIALAAGAILPEKFHVEN